MNRKQIQLNVCKELLNPSRTCAGVFINEEEFAITTDGFTAYVFDIRDCVFDISKVPCKDKLKLHFEEKKTDVEILKTGLMFSEKGKLIEKYKGVDFAVYVDSKVAKPFEGYHFFASSEKGRILVKDDFGRLLGLFLPVSFKGSEE